jgi:WhiB family redox-sensing transcriptional regulator
MSWEEQARCRQYDPEIFFAPRARAERKAKTICGKCPVKVDCLVFALQAKVEFGIWGGTNGKERRAMIRRSPQGTDWRVEVQGLSVTA